MPRRDGLVAVAAQLQVGVDVSSQLDYQPASLFVVEHIEHSYACAACHGQVVRATKTPQALEKGLPGPGLKYRLGNECDIGGEFQFAQGMQVNGVEYTGALMISAWNSQTDVGNSKFGIEQMYSVLVEEVNKGATAEAKLKSLIVAKLAYFDENRDFFKIYYSELGRIPTHPAGIDSEFKALYMQQARLVESILKEGIRKRSIRNLRTEQTAFAISDIIRGVVTQRILGWSKSRAGQDADFIFDLVWKGIAVS